MRGRGVGDGLGRAPLAEGFTRIRHQVVIGTRDVDALMARAEPDRTRTLPFSAQPLGTPMVTAKMVR